MKKLYKILKQTSPDAKPHFIVLDGQKIQYGRVPKVANSSIKEALSQFLTDEVDLTLRTTEDRFWTQGTFGQSRMVTKAEAARLNESHFSFSFVRNPFDRVVSCYNNKIVANPRLSKRMTKMKMYHRMPFDEFVRILVKTRDARIDLHLLPQSRILKVGGELIPKFIGRLENITDDWNALESLMVSRGFPSLGKLPAKNVRREKSGDMPQYFSSQELVDLVHERYRDDVETFYPGVPIADLVSGQGGKGLAPMVAL
ncbi:MAG: sulfotransferase family protein [Verrucomicrobiaceae bacterium]|nr:MAG: sulfotransferase family protein [Verrucomicrobiaceae bacterium]